MAKIGISAVRLGLDFFNGDLPTFAGPNPQQLVAVGLLVALGVIGVRNRWPAPVAETATVREFAYICSEQMYADFVTD